ncbi:MAG: DUF1499 domain-containing protein [Rubrivivax sp.]
MGLLRTIAFVVVGAAAALLVAAQFGALRGRMPDDLGVRDGRLKRPSKTPNSVSSQADLWPDHPQREYARIAPLAPAKGDAAATLAALRTLLQQWPGATIVTDRPDYLYVQFQTRVLHFVDDAEFWLDPQAQVLQVRSASRIGRKDFGVNRERVEAIRAALVAR